MLNTTWHDDYDETRKCGVLTSGRFGTIHLVDMTTETDVGFHYIIKELVFDLRRRHDRNILKTDKQEFENEVSIQRDVVELGLAPRILFVDHSDTGGIICMVRMKRTLRAYIHDMDIGTDPHHRLIEIFGTILVNIQTLHDNNIMHNDLHLENMMFDTENRMYFIDFGKSLRSGHRMFDPWVDYQTVVEFYMIAYRKLNIESVVVGFEHILLDMADRVFKNGKRVSDWSSNRA